MDEFNKKFAEKYPEFTFVHFTEAVINVDNARVTLKCICRKEKESEYNAVREKVKYAAASFFPPSVNVLSEVSFVTAGHLDILHTVMDFLQNESAYISSVADPDNVVITSGEAHSVILKLPSYVKEYAEKENICQRLKDYIDLRLFTDVTVTTETVDENVDEIRKTLTAVASEPKFSFERPNEGRTVDPAGRVALCGELIDVKAKYICDCAQPEYTVIYGVISDKREFEYTPKKPAPGEDKRKFATFYLDDGTAKMRCTWFPTASNKDAMKYIVDGAYMLVAGKTDYDTHRGDGSLKMTVRRFTGCEHTEFIVNNVVRMVDDEYRFVRPKPYVALAQSSIYADKKPHLARDPLIVFSLMTVSDNKFRPGEVIEIGAVKIDEGEIKETFSTLICPHVNMTDEERAAAGLVSSDLKGKPSSEQAFPDFFKFFSGYRLTSFPSELNTNLLKAYLEKQHIPIPEFIDITRYAEARSFKSARLKNTRRALPNALAIAKFLTSST